MSNSGLPRRKSPKGQCLAAPLPIINHRQHLLKRGKSSARPAAGLSGFGPVQDKGRQPKQPFRCKGAAVSAWRERYHTKRGIVRHSLRSQSREKGGGKGTRPFPPPGKCVCRACRPLAPFSHRRLSKKGACGRFEGTAGDGLNLHEHGQNDGAALGLFIDG